MSANKEKRIIQRYLEKAEIIVKAKKNKFDNLRRKLSNLLLIEWDKRSKEVLDEFLRELSLSDTNLTKKEINERLKRIGQILGVNFAAGVDTGVNKILFDTYRIAQTDQLGVIPKFNLTDRRALKWLHENHIYWIGTYYDRILNKKIKSVADEVIKEGLSRKEAGKRLKDKFKDEFKKSRYYWEGLSNHAVTRAREFGHTEAYVKAGIIEVEIVAVMDNRTTPICREMNGKIIPVKRMVELRDKIISAKNPEQVKKIDKWLDVKDVKGKDGEDLPLSASMPPYHFGCRTTTSKITR